MGICPKCNNKLILELLRKSPFLCPNCHTRIVKVRISIAKACICGVVFGAIYCIGIYAGFYLEGRIVYSWSFLFAFVFALVTAWYLVKFEIYSDNSNAS